MSSQVETPKPPKTSSGLGNALSNVRGALFGANALLQMATDANKQKAAEHRQRQAEREAAFQPIRDWSNQVAMESGNRDIAQEAAQRASEQTAQALKSSSAESSKRNAMQTAADEGFNRAAAASKYAASERGQQLEKKSFDTSRIFGQFLRAYRGETSPLKYAAEDDPPEEIPGQASRASTSEPADRHDDPAAMQSTSKPPASGTSATPSRASSVLSRMRSRQAQPQPSQPSQPPTDRPLPEEPRPAPAKPIAKSKDLAGSQSSARPQGAEQPPALKPPQRHAEPGRQEPTGPDLDQPEQSESEPPSVQESIRRGASYDRNLIQSSSDHFQKWLSDKLPTITDPDVYNDMSKVEERGIEGMLVNLGWKYHRLSGDDLQNTMSSAYALAMPDIEKYDPSKGSFTKYVYNAIARQVYHVMKAEKGSEETDTRKIRPMTMVNPETGEESDRPVSENEANRLKQLREASEMRGMGTEQRLVTAITTLGRDNPVMIREAKEWLSGELGPVGMEILHRKITGGDIPELEMKYGRNAVAKELEKLKTLEPKFRSWLTERKAEEPTLSPVEREATAREAGDVIPQAPMTSLRTAPAEQLPDRQPKYSHDPRDVSFGKSLIKKFGPEKGSLLKWIYDMKRSGVSAVDLVNDRKLPKGARGQPSVLKFYREMLAAANDFAARSGSPDFTGRITNRAASLLGKPKPRVIPYIRHEEDWDDIRRFVGNRIKRGELPPAAEKILNGALLGTSRIDDLAKDQDVIEAVKEKAKRSPMARVREDAPQMGRHFVVETIRRLKPLILEYYRSAGMGDKVAELQNRFKQEAEDAQRKLATRRGEPVPVGVPRSRTPEAQSEYYRSRQEPKRSIDPASLKLKSVNDELAKHLGEHGTTAMALIRKRLEGRGLGVAALDPAMTEALEKTRPAVRNGRWGTAVAPLDRHVYNWFATQVMPIVARVSPNLHSVLKMVPKAFNATYHPMSFSETGGNRR